MSNGTTWPDRTRTDLETRIEALRAELSSLEAELERLDDVEQEASTPAQLPLRMDEYKRYGRQMILPGFGLPGTRPDFRAGELPKARTEHVYALHRTVGAQASSVTRSRSRWARLSRYALSSRSWHW